MAGCSTYGTVCHGSMKKPRRNSRFRVSVAVVEQLPPFVVLARAVGAGAERGADVLQVVPHHAAAVLDDDGVERVAGLHVDQVGPRAEHLQRAQLAAVLVRHDVVRIVGARAVVPEPADRTAGHGARGDGAIACRPRCGARA